VASDVVIMPNAADAQAVLSTINAPSYGTSCFQPGLDANVKNSLASLGARCDLSFQNSQIGQMSPSVLGPQMTGYRYAANVLCSETGQTAAFYIDVINQQVGPVFIQARVSSFGDAPPTSLEQSVMGAMATRAISPTN